MTFIVCCLAKATRSKFNKFNQSVIDILEVCNTILYNHCNLSDLFAFTVNKNDTKLNTRAKLKNTNSEPLLGLSQMKRTQSDDALTNINTSRSSVRAQPAGSSVRKVNHVEEHEPIRLDGLADYVKNKRAETKDGLKLEYSVSIILEETTWWYQLLLLGRFCL